MLEICAQSADGVVLDAASKARLEARYRAWSTQGIRVLAVASRTLEPQPSYDRELERDLSFVGFLTFFDRPKADVSDAIRSLAALGVSIKVITGDCKPVTQHVAALVGLRAAAVEHALHWPLHGGVRGVSSVFDFLPREGTYRRYVPPRTARRAA